MKSLILLLLGWFTLFQVTGGFTTKNIGSNLRMFNNAFMVRVRVRVRNEVSMSTVLGRLSAKMGSVVQLLSGQSTITASNIEATVKVPYAMSLTFS